MRDSRCIRKGLRLLCRYLKSQKASQSDRDTHLPTKCEGHQYPCALTSLKLSEGDAILDTWPKSITTRSVLRIKGTQSPQRKCDCKKNGSFLRGLCVFFAPLAVQSFGMDFWAASLIMRNIALLPEYDGTAYGGWQVQKV